MPLTIAQDFETSISNALDSYVNGMSTAVASAAKPLFVAGVTIYFLMIAYRMAFGRTDEPASESLIKMFKISFISALAFTAADYQTIIVDFIYDLSGGLMMAVGAKPTIGETIDNAAEPFLHIYETLNARSTLNPFTALSYTMQAVVFLVIELLFFIVAIGYFMLTKVALAILLAIGPIFILLAAFPATQRYTESWLNQVLQYVALQVLLATIFGLFITIAKFFTDKAASNLDTISFARDLYSLEFILLAMVVVMFNVNSIAAALTGGIGLDAMSSTVARMALSGASGGGRSPAPMPTVNTLRPANPPSPPLYNQIVRERLLGQKP